MKRFAYVIEMERFAYVIEIYVYIRRLSSLKIIFINLHLPKVIIVN
jgi:hypothetical protein